MSFFPFPFLFLPPFPFLQQRGLDRHGYEWLGCVLMNALHFIAYTLFCYLSPEDLVVLLVFLFSLHSNRTSVPLVL